MVAGSVMLAALMAETGEVSLQQTDANRCERDVLSCVYGSI